MKSAWKNGEDVRKKVKGRENIALCCWLQGAVKQMPRGRKIKELFSEPWNRLVHLNKRVSRGNNRNDGWKGKVGARWRRDLNPRPTSLDLYLRPWGATGGSREFRTCHHGRGILERWIWSWYRRWIRRNWTVEELKSKHRKHYLSYWNSLRIGKRNNSYLNFNFNFPIVCPWLSPIDLTIL